MNPLRPSLSRTKQESERIHEKSMAFDLCHDNWRLAVGYHQRPVVARRVARGSSYDGTWSVAVYTLRGDCGSIRAALRIVGGRVYSEDQSYQAYGAVGSGGTIRVTLVRHRAPAGCRIARRWSMAYVSGRVLGQLVGHAKSGLLLTQPSFGPLCRSEPKAQTCIRLLNQRFGAAEI